MLYTLSSSRPFLPFAMKRSLATPATAAAASTAPAADAAALGGPNALVLAHIARARATLDGGAPLKLPAHALADCASELASLQPADVDRYLALKAEVYHYGAAAASLKALHEKHSAEQAQIVGYLERVRECQRLNRFVCDVAICACMCHVYFISRRHLRFYTHGIDLYVSPGSTFQILVE